MCTCVCRFRVWDDPGGVAGHPGGGGQAGGPAHGRGRQAGQQRDRLHQDLAEGPLPQVHDALQGDQGDGGPVPQGEL